MDDDSGAPFVDEAGEERDSYAPEPSSAPVEPGDPKLEHAAFVLLGAIATVLVMIRIAAIAMI